MKTQFAGFDWDSGNWPKCGKHGVSVEEIEEVLAGMPAITPDLTHSQKETRFLAIGQTILGRHIFVCFTVRERHGATYLRPISARFMGRKEVAAYEKASS